jgi:hypothetical protein
MLEEFEPTIKIVRSSVGHTYMHKAARDSQYSSTKLSSKLIPRKFGYTTTPVLDEGVLAGTSRVTV